jgi:hypothetical protein
MVDQLIIKVLLVLVAILIGLVVGLVTGILVKSGGASRNVVFTAGGAAFAGTVGVVFAAMTYLFP